MNVVAVMPYKSFRKLNSFLSTEFLVYVLRSQQFKEGETDEPSAIPKGTRRKWVLGLLDIPLLRVNFHCLLIQWLPESVDSHSEKWTRLTSNWFVISSSFNHLTYKWIYFTYYWMALLVLYYYWFRIVI